MKKAIRWLFLFAILLAGCSYRAPIKDVVGIWGVSEEEAKRLFDEANESVEPSFYVKVAEYISKLHYTIKFQNEEILLIVKCIGQPDSKVFKLSKRVKNKFMFGPPEFGEGRLVFELIDKNSMRVLISEFTEEQKEPRVFCYLEKKHNQSL